MREIKFRAYHPKLGMYPSEKWGYEYEDWINGDNPVMQYTGLKDKNGRELFEGDIVKFEDEQEPEYEEEVEGEIVFQDAAFWVKVGPESFYLLTGIKVPELIGNKWESSHHNVEQQV